MITNWTYNGEDYREETTDELHIYKFLTGVYINRARGGKEYKRIEYIEKYDGLRHIKITVSNGTKIEIEIER